MKNMNHLGQEAAQCANEIVEKYIESTKLDLNDPNLIGNLLCDLMHYCTLHNIDFKDQLAYAKNHEFFE